MGKIKYRGCLRSHQEKFKRYPSRVIMVQLYTINCGDARAWKPLTETARPDITLFSSQGEKKIKKYT